MLSHYRLVEKIGEGGMGVVWKAEDTVLNRTVAIKVLPADLALDEERRRMFLDEARLAASVSHGNIVQVHELGREGDLDFIVMEYVEGKPLSKTLHGPPLPPDKAAELGLQVAQGLARAHRKKLIHRDLKPANILVTSDGDVKIVDFGLATLFSRSDSTAVSRASTLAEMPEQEKQPAIAGTLPYMSPEQVRGEQLDARSDIFSFGCVLYEMTTGQRPFKGARATDVAREVLRSEPTPVHELVPRVPLDLYRIIEKALARRPADRYQHTDDVVVDLRRLGRELETGSSPRYDEVVRFTRRRIPATWRRYVVVGLAVLAVFLSIRYLPTRQTSLDHRTILVLPFESRGDEQRADYVGRAFAQALAVHIAQAPALKVLAVPSTSVDEDERIALAREAGAGRVVSGTLLRHGNGTEITVTMLDTADNSIVWGTQTTVSHTNLSAVASTLSRETVEVLGEQKARLYDYIQNVSGSAEMAASSELAETKGHLDRHEDLDADRTATRLVSSFPAEPDAWLLKSWVKLRLWYRQPSDEYVEDIHSGIERLLYLDPESPYPSMLRGLVLRGQGDHDRAVSLFTEVLSRDDLTPEFRAWALRQRANANMSLGQLPESEEDLKRALEYDPTNAFTRQDLSRLLRNMERYAESAEVSLQALALRPDDFQSYTNVAMSLDHDDKRAEATPYYEKAVELNPSQFTHSLLANHLQLRGLRARAVASAQVADTHPDTPYGCYNLAEAWAGMGDLDKALSFLRRAVDAGYSDLWLLENDPDLSALRSEPGFQSLVQEVRNQLGQD
jgi:serine/threonine protein kinase/tetratricopeptide (TPR) repeat protein